MADKNQPGASADASARLEESNEVADQEAVDETSVESSATGKPEAAVEPEAVAEEPRAEPAADTDDADEAATPGDGEPPAASAEADAPASGSEPEKRKKKRLPRALRPQRTRRRRVASGERAPIVRLEPPEQERGRRQERQGTVVSDAMEKTIVVRVDVVKAHPRYKKVVRRSVKFHAHDEQGQAKVGDVVRIVETRPLSKTKRWRLAEVVEAAK